MVPDTTILQVGFNGIVEFRYTRFYSTKNGESCVLNFRVFMCLCCGEIKRVNSEVDTFYNSFTFTLDEGQVGE